MFGRKRDRSAEGGGNAATETPLAREIRSILSQTAGQHPLDVAARLAALFGAQDYVGDRIDFIRIQNIDHPTVCDLQGMEGDPVGLSFSFAGTAGESGLIYLTTTFAQLAPQGTEPGPRVPAEMISRYVRDYDQAVRKLAIQRSPGR